MKTKKAPPKPKPTNTATPAPDTAGRSEHTPPARLTRAYVKTLPEAEKNRLRAEALALRIKGQEASGTSYFILSDRDAARLGELTRCGLSPSDPTPPAPRTLERDKVLRDMAARRRAAPALALEYAALCRKAEAGQALTPPKELEPPEQARLDELRATPGAADGMAILILHDMAEAERVRGHMRAAEFAEEVSRFERILSALEARGNIFARMSPDVWIVYFKGRRAMLPGPSKGLDHIRRILADPDGLTPLELVEKPEQPEGGDRDMLATAHQDEKDRRAYMQDPEVKAHVADLQERLRDADADGEKATVAAIRRRLREYGLTPMGMRRPRDKATERPRDSVRRAIQRAIEDIRRDHPEAARYLKKHLQTAKGRWAHTGPEQFTTG